MTSRASSGPGSSPGTSSATPAELQKAAQGFLKFSNACAGMLDSPDLQSGGDLELQAIQPQNTATTAGPVSVPADFNTMLEEVAQGFLGVLLNARQQFADASVDLMQVAGDFHTADHTLPSGSKLVPDPGEGIPAGIKVYESPSGQTYYKDKDGTVVTGIYPYQKGGVANPNAWSDENIVGQTYSAPKGTKR